MILSADVIYTVKTRVFGRLFFLDNSLRSESSVSDPENNAGDFSTKTASKGPLETSEMLWSAVSYLQPLENPRK